MARKRGRPSEDDGSHIFRMHALLKEQPQVSLRAAAAIVAEEFGLNPISTHAERLRKKYQKSLRNGEIAATEPLSEELVRRLESTFERNRQYVLRAVEALKQAEHKARSMGLEVNLDEEKLSERIRELRGVDIQLELLASPSPNDAQVSILVGEAEDLEDAKKRALAYRSEWQLAREQHKILAEIAEWRGVIHRGKRFLPKLGKN